MKIKNTINRDFNFYAQLPIYPYKYSFTNKDKLSQTIIRMIDTNKL